MADERTATGEAGITRCEFCGADYDPAPQPPRAPVPAPAPGAVGAEPTTRCEFCGAEYPVPDDAG